MAENKDKKPTVPEGAAVGRLLRADQARELGFHDSQDSDIRLELLVVFLSHGGEMRTPVFVFVGQDIRDPVVGRFNRAFFRHNNSKSEDDLWV